MFGVAHRKVEFIAVLDQVGLVHIGADRDRMLQIKKRIRLPAYADISAYAGVVGKPFAAPFLMTGKKTIKSDSGGQAHLFCQLERHEIEVINFLSAVREKNDPSGIQHKHEVAVIALDGQRTGDRTACHIHDHRIACPGLYGKLF